MIIRHFTNITGLPNGDFFISSSSSQKYNSCLVMKSSAESAAITEDVRLLRPTLVLASPGFQINFTNVFHSSVWAFLLLAIILVRICLSPNLYRQLPPIDCLLKDNVRMLLRRQRIINDKMHPSFKHFPSFERVPFVSY